MKRDNKSTGRKGEREAGELLRKKGYEILATNYGNKWGEIDIVTGYKSQVTGKEYRIFVEVKTKTEEMYGEPWEMIDRRKLKRVENMGHLWCREFEWDGLCRIDVIGVWLDNKGEVTKIKHWENVQL